LAVLQKAGPGTFQIFCLVFGALGQVPEIRKVIQVGICQNFLIFSSGAEIFSVSSWNPWNTILCE
jgi:hypothetical protein